MHTGNDTQSAPLISVIMPVYNCEKYVGAAIESICDQSYQNWELLICDDGSSDGSRAELLKYQRDARIKFQNNPSNIGKIRTVTNLYGDIKGEYVVFHDSDDISHRDRFKLQVQALIEDPSIGLVGCGYFMIDDKNKVLNRVIPPDTHEKIVSHIQISSPFHFPTVMFRKHLLDREKKLFRDFFGDNNEDVDLCYRILTRSKGKNINEILYVYRILENSISRKKILRNATYFYAIAKDLALLRMNGMPDWLDDPEIVEHNLKAYFRLKDPTNILIYANAVSYFLSYRMYLKAIKASCAAFAYVSFIRAFKLLMIAFLQIMQLLIKRKKKEQLNLQKFVNLQVNVR